MTHDSSGLRLATPDFERHSRAVLSADLVGYTRLMEAAESETHAGWRTLRVMVIDPTIVSYRGEVVKNTGDGFIAVFVSPQDAIECAVELQRKISAHEASRPPDRRMVFRMGLHWDPIIFDDRDVYGSGVNIAVRLQAVAPEGGILVSSALVEQVSGPSGCELEDLGELPLKNLTRQVHALALRPPGADETEPFGSRHIKKAAEPPAVAVLPFAYVSSDLQDNYFAEGFADDIIVSLSNIPELLVVSRGSTMAFRQRPVDPDEISEKLGVRYLLSGSVRCTSNRIRISVELIDAADASVIWAERFDEPIEELFNLQDEIALRIVSKIATCVRRAELQRALRKPPQSLNAYEHFLHGLDLLYRFDAGSFVRARTFLERARMEDRDYAAPYAFLALWHVFKIGEGWSSDVDADAAEVMRLAQCAIERDPHNALALALEGHGRGMFFRDYDAAIELVDRATAVSPNNSWAWMFSSGPYGFVGDASAAVRRAERALRLSPLDQHAFFTYTLLAQNHYLGGTLEDAVRWSRKALHLNPRFGNAARVLAASLVATDRLAEAQEIGRHHKRHLPSFKLSEYSRRCPFKETQAKVYVESLRAAGIDD